MSISKGIYKKRKHGTIPNEITRAKISLALKGNKNGLGKHRGFSDEVKIKMSEARKRFYSNGGQSWNKGKKHSEETRRKIVASKAGQPSYVRTLETRKKNSESKKAEKNPNWQGGITGELGFYSARYRMRKLNNGGSHTKGEWETLKAQYNWICLCCKRKEPEIKLTADHIIPVSKGGSNNIENIQPLCQRCNTKKMTKIIHYELEEVLK